MKISVIDWYPSFQLCKEVLLDVLETSLQTRLRVVESHAAADMILIGPYGLTHKFDSSFISSKAWKLYMTGENTVPDFRYIDHSLSFIRHDFNSRNFRLPLWWLHLSYSGMRESTSFNFEESTEFFTTNKPLRKYLDMDDERHESVIAVFNHPDPMRLWTIQVLNQHIPVVKYGECFGNGFEWGDHGYKKKIELVAKYRFNYCPENSLHDGYFTEKILHARLAGCIPIVYADKYVSLDFNPKGLVNIYDFESIEDLSSYVLELSNDENLMSQIVNEGVCNRMPDIDSLFEFIRQSYSDYTNQLIRPCTDEIKPITHVEVPSLFGKIRRRISRYKR